MFSRLQKKKFFFHDSKKKKIFSMVRPPKKMPILALLFLAVTACPEYLRQRIADCVKNFDEDGCAHFFKECRTHDAEKCISHVDAASRIMSKHCPGHIMQRMEDLRAFVYEQAA